MRYVKFAAILAAAVLLIWQSVYGAAIDDKDFTLEDVEGDSVRLSDHKGKIVVLEWTNYDCPFVKAHYAPEVMTTAKLAGKYVDSGVVWLTINSTHYATAESTKKWAEPLDLPQTVLMDSDGTVGRLFGAETTPHIFILNSDGELVYQGALDNAPLGKVQGDAYVNYAEQAIEELLAGEAVTAGQTTPYGCSVKYPPEPES